MSMRVRGFKGSRETIAIAGRNKHQRRSLRLPEYDYSSEGAYFVTICVQDKKCLFGDIIDRKMHFTEYGRIVYDEWIKTPEIRDEIKLDEFVIMPNHFHAGVWIVGATGRSPLRNGKPRGPKPKSIGSLIAGFKSAVTKRINESRNTLGQRVWQRNYYERVIRNEPELTNIRQYIINNPLQWQFDQENPEFVRARRTVAKKEII